MIPTPILVIVAIVAWVWTRIREDNAYQKGMEYGWDAKEKLINLKIRQDGYILDGKRVRKTVDEHETPKDIADEGLYGGTQEP